MGWCEKKVDRRHLEEYSVSDEFGALMENMLTNKDVQTIADLIRNIVDPQFDSLKKDMAGLKLDVSNLTSSVDEFMRTVRRHDQEWLILRTQHDKIRNVLIKKGIASEDELSVTS